MKFGVFYEHQLPRPRAATSEYSCCSGHSIKSSSPISLGMTINGWWSIISWKNTLPNLLSCGRVDLGMGEAAGPAELHPYGERVRDKRERWKEVVPRYCSDVHL
jgi:hypothetical protein